MERKSTPPNEDCTRPVSKRGSGSYKSKGTLQRITKRAAPGSNHGRQSPVHEPLSSHGDGRNKRVWKACERCRMKKTKCDGEFPCKRCKDDGLVCTAGTRKKTEYKQLPKGYAEVLEHTQLALVATVHKLYAMLRASQAWELGEPEVNERGQPVIHDIASRLGCIRPLVDADLPVPVQHAAIPEDEAAMAELAMQLQLQQNSQPLNNAASSDDDWDHSDLDNDYRHVAFGRAAAATLGQLSSASPQSLPSDSFADPCTPANAMLPYVSEWLSASASDISNSASTASSSSSSSVSLALATAQRLLEQQQQQPAFFDMDLLNQGLLESSFGTLKPHVLSCPNPEVMMGVGDPMIYGGYDPDRLRL